MTSPLSSTVRRDLRARAHRLHPVVSISQKGLSATVMAEIEAALVAHELIKIRIYGTERTERDQLLTQVCEHTGAAAVQHIGNILIVYRERPKTETPAVKRKAPAARKPQRRPAPYAQKPRPRKAAARKSPPRRRT